MRQVEAEGLVLRGALASQASGLCMYMYKNSQQGAGPMSRSPMQVPGNVSGSRKLE